MYCSAHSVSSLSLRLICLPPCEVFCNAPRYSDFIPAPLCVHSHAHAYILFAQSCTNANVKLLVTYFTVCYQYRSSNTRLSYNKAKFSIFNVYTFVTGRTVFWHWETSFPFFLYLPSLHSFTARICSFHQFSCCPQVFLPFPTCRCIKRRRAVEERSGEPKQGRR